MGPEDGEMNEMTLPSRHRFQNQTLEVWGRARYLSGHVICKYLHTCVPANTRHRANVGAMLAQRLRRWLNIGPTMGQCLVYTGIIWSCRVAGPGCSFGPVVARSSEVLGSNPDVCHRGCAYTVDLVIFPRFYFSRILREGQIREFKNLAKKIIIIIALLKKNKNSRILNHVKSKKKNREF